MAAADTNILVRLIVEDDPVQVAAANAFVASGVWISHLVLAETTWVLRSTYGLTARQIVLAIEMLLATGHATFEDRDIVVNALDAYRSTPALRFSDCLILEIARKAGHLPLGTFDRTLAKLDGAQRL